MPPHVPPTQPCTHLRSFAIAIPPVLSPHSQGLLPQDISFTLLSFLTFMLSISFYLLPSRMSTTGSQGYNLAQYSILHI